VVSDNTKRNESTIGGVVDTAKEIRHIWRAFNWKIQKTAPNLAEARSAVRALPDGTPWILTSTTYGNYHVRVMKQPTLGQLGKINKRLRDAEQWQMDMRKAINEAREPEGVTT